MSEKQFREENPIIELIEKLAPRKADESYFVESLYGNFFGLVWRKDENSKNLSFSFDENSGYKVDANQDFQSRASRIEYLDERMQGEIIDAFKWIETDEILVEGWSHFTI